jgi:hypothetical protein
MISSNRCAIESILFVSLEPHQPFFSYLAVFTITGDRAEM